MANYFTLLQYLMRHMTGQIDKIRKTDGVNKTRRWLLRLTHTYLNRKYIQMISSIWFDTKILYARGVTGLNFKIYMYSGLQIIVYIGKLFSLFLIQNICCGYSKEPSQWDGSFECPKHMFGLMGKKIITILR